MPDYDVCNLMVTGPNNDIATFLAGLKRDKRGHYCVCDSYVPMPDALVEHNLPLVRTGGSSPLDTGQVFTPTGVRPLTAEDREYFGSLKASYGYDNWYDWQCANWGTKWGDCDTRLHKRDPLVLRFVCAWKPILPAIQTISRQFPTLGFTLHGIRESPLHFRYWIRIEAGRELHARIAYIGDPPPVDADQIAAAKADPLKWARQQYADGPIRIDVETGTIENPDGVGFVLAVDLDRVRTVSEQRGYVLVRDADEPDGRGHYFSLTPDMSNLGHDEADEVGCE